MPAEARYRQPRRIGTNYLYCDVRGGELYKYGRGQRISRTFIFGSNSVPLSAAARSSMLHALGAGLLVLQYCGCLFSSEVLQHANSILCCFPCLFAVRIVYMRRTTPLTHFLREHFYILCVFQPRPARTPFRPAIWGTPVADPGMKAKVTPTPSKSWDHPRTPPRASSRR